MNDDVIKQGIAYMYGDLLKNHPNSVSILLLCFASVIYHIELLKEVIDKNPRYLFSTLPLLQDEELLKKLKRLVTRDLSAMKFIFLVNSPFRLKKKRFRSALQIKKRRLQSINSISIMFFFDNSTVRPLLLEKFQIQSILYLDFLRDHMNSVR